MRATPLAPRLSAARRPALASLPGLLALASVACSSAPAATQAPKPGALPGDTSAPGAPSPARYLVTRYFGALFDQGSDGAAVPRPEFAILQGRRVKLDGGAILATVRSPAGLLGFRSLPAHLGGGYLLWSDVRTFHAKDFLGELTPVAELGPAAGTTPWFSSVLLHTDRGIFELDLKTRAVTPWRLHPGVVGARALDDKRGVTIDLFGRARVTTDGGQKWTDLVAAHGYLTSALRTGRKGEIELVSLTGSADFRLVPGGSAVEPGLPPPPPYNRRYYGYSSYPYQYINQPPPPESDHVYPISQTQAHEALAGAVSGGLLLSGDRVLVGREGGAPVGRPEAGGRDRPLTTGSAHLHHGIGGQQHKIADGRALKAVIPGGSSTVILTADEADKVTLDFDSLVGAGTSSSGQALVRLSQLDPLRLVLPVPASAVPRIRDGMPVEVHVQATGETIPGTVTRSSGEVSTSTRTMHVEVDVRNPKSTLAPGMYATATLIQDSRRDVLSLPVEAVPDRRQGAAHVLALDAQNRVVERTIHTGLETETQVEVTSGLGDGELVLVGARRVQPGQVASPKLIGQEAGK